MLKTVNSALAVGNILYIKDLQIKKNLRKYDFMGKIPHTTVNLTETAQKVKDDLAPVFGLKNILSAGLVLFGKLSTDEQKSVIMEALDTNPKSKEREVKK